MKIKLLFLDMEGTLFAKQRLDLGSKKLKYHPSLWARLMYELGAQTLQKNSETVEKWESGLYPNYMSWVEESLQILKCSGLSRKQFETVVNGIPFNPGVREALSTVHQRGIKTVIISGGFMAQARRAQQLLKINHAFASADLYWDSKERLVHWNIFPTDYEGKVEVVRLMMREYGAAPQECAFVGDGRNDIPIAAEVGLSIAYQGAPELKQMSTYSIDDFNDITGILSSRPESSQKSGGRDASGRP